jgi:hypothetical protein
MPLWKLAARSVFFYYEDHEVQPGLPILPFI